MKSHPTKFDEHLLKLARNKACGLPSHAGFNEGASKVRNGQANAAQSLLPSSVLEKIHQKWKDVMTNETGYETYDECRLGINRELKRKFI